MNEKEREREHNRLELRLIQCSLLDEHVQRESGHGGTEYLLRLNTETMIYLDKDY